MMLCEAVWCVCSVMSNSCSTLDCGLPGSSDPGNFWAAILEHIAIPTPGDLPDPGIEPASPVSPVLAGGFFTPAPPGKPSVVWRWVNGELKATSGLSGITFASPLVALNIFFFSVLLEFLQSKLLSEYRLAD